MYKIIGADGQPYGPVTADQIRRWITENRVNAQTLVQADGAADWRPLSTYAEFNSEASLGATPPPFASAPPPVPPAFQAAPGTPAMSDLASKKIAAGIFGILLGCLGIHKFILGYTSPGIVMLVVTLVAGFCTGGLAAIVMAIIGLIEGILYLTKSDAEFVRTYVTGRREWF